MPKSRSKKTSFKSRIWRFNYSMLGVVTVFIIIFVYLNLSLFSNYNSSYYQYKQLSEFYNNMRESNSEMKLYLYSFNEEVLTEYKDSITKVRENIQNLQNESTQSDENWRFQLLDRMVDTYELSVENVLNHFENGEPYEESFQAFNHVYETVMNTSGNFYQIVTNQMDEMRLTMISQIKIGSVIIVGGFIVFIIWLCFFSYITIKNFTNPINKIIENIKSIKAGKYDLREVSDSNKEMEILCINIEDMVASIQANLHNEKERAHLQKMILDHKNENLSKDELYAQAKLRMLQSQLDPHFLFNTLNIIYKLSILEEAKETGELLEKASQYLRYNLDYINSESNLTHEISALRDYIYIQSIRFQNRINFEIDVEENLPNIKIPGLIIQPLVENAIVHGLKNVMEDGEISISVYRSNGMLNISVSDNGEGLSEEVIDDFMANDFTFTKAPEQVGLHNSIVKLKMFFQNCVHIAINTSIDCGFEIVMQIEMGDENV